MRKTLTVLVLALTAALSSVAAAQVQPERKWTKSDDCALQRARNPKAACELAIEAEDLTGTIVTPGGERVVVRPEAKQPSLIRYRTDFVAQIVRSAEQR